jgi:GDPmannose 4,6-dehydratase
MLIGDPSKARKQLQWEPSVSFEELVKLMVDADLQALGLKSKGEESTALLDKATLRASRLGI